ncbi:MAG: hypothetical protein PHQ28_00470 [Mycobacterium sp.]|nr:hypothetical protein [Mycobacterium sp.]
MSSSSKAPGLGDRQGVSTRPTREERRREAERVQPDPTDDTAAAAQEADSTRLAKLARRKEPKKIALNTYITPDAHKRLEWLKDQNCAVTNIVEEALDEYFDQVGVPAADAL